MQSRAEIDGEALDRQVAGELDEHVVGQAVELHILGNAHPGVAGSVVCIGEQAFVGEAHVGHAGSFLGSPAGPVVLAESRGGSYLHGHAGAVGEITDAAAVSCGAFGDSVEDAVGVDCGHGSVIYSPVEGGGVVAVFGAAYVAHHFHGIFACAVDKELLHAQCHLCVEHGNGFRGAHSVVACGESAFGGAAGGIECIAGAGAGGRLAAEGVVLEILVDHSAVAVVGNHFGREGGIYGSLKGHGVEFETCHGVVIGGVLGSDGVNHPSVCHCTGSAFGGAVLHAVLNEHLCGAAGIEVGHVVAAQGAHEFAHGCGVAACRCAVHGVGALVDNDYVEGFAVLGAAIAGA